MNKNNCIEGLIRISQAVGNKPEFVQGGGGNTSVKFDEKLMAVKASGFKLNQISLKEGFVIVDYNMIKNYFENINLDNDRDYEKESGEFLRKSVIETENLQKLRPSVETGFHSILKKYVIHTHSVYTNILCCSKEGRDLINDIFNSEKNCITWVPYVNPGFELTIKIKEVIRECIDKKGCFPEAIFMENHGLIVNSDDIEECLNIHEKINFIIRRYFNIENNYPNIKIEKYNNNLYKSRTKFLNNYFGNKNIFDKTFFDKFTLYPDQLVYLNNSLATEELGKNPVLEIRKGELIYNTDYGTSMTIEETLLSVIYIIDIVKKLGLNLKVMTDSQKAFINGWESEKYRKSMIIMEK